MSDWLVIRQDDNGNIYVVAEQLSERDARELAARYEARAHKQMYSATARADFERRQPT